MLVFNNNNFVYNNIKYYYLTMIHLVFIGFEKYSDNVVCIGCTVRKVQL